MDSPFLFAYMFDIGWFLLLTGALMLAAMGLIVFRPDPWDASNYEPEKKRKG